MFIHRFAEDSGKRLTGLRTKDGGQLLAILCMLGRALPSTHGPTADTGGLMRDRPPTSFAYANLDALFAGEAVRGAKALLPGSGNQLFTERPAAR